MKRVLVVRNDKIGDFMLAWPSFAMLKTSMPCHITALVPAYTAPLAELCPWIDDLIIDPGHKADKVAQRQLQNRLRHAAFDAAICLFSNARNAWLMWRAHIPYRLAPATKLAQLLYNQRLTQRRSRSAKPEFAYNLDLIRRFLTDHAQPIIEPSAPYLAFSATQLSQVRQQLSSTHHLNPNAPWLMIHAGSGGSANSLSVAQFTDLILRVNHDHPQAECLLTAGPGEEELAEQIAAQVLAQGGNIWIYRSTDGLTTFCQVLANAALFMAGSTGPLHIAAALDVPTVGFFPQHRSATPLRWQPLNSTGRHIAFSPPAGGSNLDDMSQISTDVIAPQIAAWATQFLNVAPSASR
ncbi:MAG: glycosyltransferase family 9 protein [Aeromonas sp.]